jgi:hypothetical protein
VTLLFERYNARNASIVVITLFLVFSLGFLLSRQVPFHDTRSMFSIFYFFYNEVYLGQAWPLWMPQASYGIPTGYFQTVALTPVSYLTIAVGALLRVPDVMVVWKISLIAEELLLVGGMFVLARHLRLSSLASAAVAILCLGTLFAQAQIFFCLRIFYLFPLAIACLIRFVERRDPLWFWFWALLCLLNSWGNPPYLAVFWFWCCLLLVFLLKGGMREVWDRRLWTRPRNMFIGAGVIVLALLHLYFLVHLVNGVDIVSAGRSSSTGRVSENAFLIYGGFPDYKELLRGLIDPRVFFLKMGSGPDITVYTGVAALVLVCFALFSRLREGWAFIIFALVMIGIASGSFIARIAYYLPGMSFFRHIGFLYPFVKLIVIIIAGFGVDAAIRILKGWQRILLVVILLVGAVEIACFQVQARVHAQTVPAGLEAVFKVHHMSYQAQRRFDPEEAFQKDRVAFLDSPGQGMRYYYDYGFAQFEPCLSRYGELQMTSSLARLSKINPFLPALLGGCWEPKLRLFTDVQRVDSDQQETAFFSGLRTVMDQAVQDDPRRIPAVLGLVFNHIRNTATVRGFDEKDLHENISSEQIGAVKVVGFSPDSLRLEAEVYRPSGALLFYADAFHPGWRATVDGQRTPIFQANGGYKSIYMPAGPHQVHFFFHEGLASLINRLYLPVGAGLGLWMLILLGTLFRKIETSNAQGRT